MVAGKLSLMSTKLLPALGKAKNAGAGGIAGVGGGDDNHNRFDKDDKHKNSWR